MIAASAGHSLRELREADAAFLLQLTNEPSWLANIGDRGLRSLDDARRHIRERLQPDYQRQGFGLYLIERQDDGQALGVCGLFRREALPLPDLGFALLPAYWGQGHAEAAARLLMAHARRALGLGRLLAISSPPNQRSQRLLQRLGFQPAGETRLGEQGETLALFDSGLLPDAPPLDAPPDRDALLLAQLRDLEAELHHPGRPCTPARLAQLLHEDFFEVGRSGRAYSRQTVLAYLGGAVTPTAVAACGYRLQRPGAEVALLHYRSAHRLQDGQPLDWALRLSCWQAGPQGWQLRYHQGTPAALDHSSP